MNMKSDLRRNKHFLAVVKIWPEKKLRPVQDSTYDLCDTGVVLY